jgi:hypothetical protein
MRNSHSSYSPTHRKADGYTRQRTGTSSAPSLLSHGLATRLFRCNLCCNPCPLSPLNLVPSPDSGLPGLRDCDVCCRKLWRKCAWMMELAWAKHGIPNIRCCALVAQIRARLPLLSADFHSVMPTIGCKSQSQRHQIGIVRTARYLGTDLESTGEVEPRLLQLGVRVSLILRQCRRQSSILLLRDIVRHGDAERVEGR